MSHKSIENIFTYKEIDAVDFGIYFFKEVTLKIPVGDHPVGTRFHAASVIYESGEFWLWDCADAEEPIEKYKIQLQIGTLI